MRESIGYLINKIKSAIRLLNKNDVFIVILIIFSSTASFGLGRLSKIEESRPDLQISSVANVLNDQEIAGKYVASKNGTKYHLPWCSGAQTISEINKIWFETKEEAENRGYTPAKNCKGI